MAHVPEPMREQRSKAAWGSARSACNAFPFRAATFGNVTVALAPDRGRSADRRADYHDPTLPPRHELIAFGLWLRRKARRATRIVHVGAHGTLEWLPGKTVALSRALLPRDRHGRPAGRLSVHRLATPAKPRRPSGASRR